MTLTECTICFVSLWAPPHSYISSIVSSHALFDTQERVGALPSALCWHGANLLCLWFVFSWARLSGVPSILHCAVMPWKTTSPSPAASDGCGKSSALCSPICSALLATDTARGAMLACFVVAPSFTWSGHLYPWNHSNIGILNITNSKQLYHYMS